MARTKKFNFSKILFNGGYAEKAGDPSALITKGGQLIFSKNAIQKLGFNGALVDFKWDSEKRALGWKKLNNVSLKSDDWTKTMRLLRTDQKGIIRVPIGRIMNAVGLEKNNYKGLLIEEYQDVMEHSKIYYVVIPRIKKENQHA